MNVEVNQLGKVGERTDISNRIGKQDAGRSSMRSGILPADKISVTVHSKDSQLSEIAQCADICQWVLGDTQSNQIA